MELSLGDRPYIDDLTSPMMLHAALRLTEHSRAEILGIDTAAASQYPGVVRVITAADVPGDLRVGLIHKDWPVFIPVGRANLLLGGCLGDGGGVRCPDRPGGRRSVEVQYRVFTPVSDPEQALASEDAVWGLEGNLLSRSAYERG